MAGTYGQRWLAGMQRHFSQYGHVYQQARQCKNLADPVARVDCAAQVMASIKTSKMGALMGGAGAAPALPPGGQNVQWY